MKLRFSHQQNQALTLTEVLVVIAVVIFLIVFLLPAIVASKQKARRIACANNLKEIGIAFRIWEGDHEDKYPMAVSVTNGGAMGMIGASNAYVLWQTISNQLRFPKSLWCPADTNTFPATNFSAGFSDANISYFLNLYADEMYPQMIIDGDDNLLVDGKRVQPGILNLWTNSSVAWTKDRHHGVGIIGMADGHVEQPAGKGLNSAVVSSTSGVPTNNAANRWLIP